MTAASLDYALVHGTVEGSLDTLFAAWQMDVIKIRLPGMAGFAASPSLGNKIRGALGATLLMSASEAVRKRQPCDWDHTCAAEIFFGSRPTILLGSHSSEIPKPFVLSVLGAGDGSLSICTRVFGLARDHTRVVAETMVRALRESVHWKEMTNDGPRFLPKRIEPSNIEVATVGVAGTTSAIPDTAAMVFQTPIDSERGDVGDEPELVMQRLVRRLALLAPWQGVSLREIFPTLVDVAGRVAVERIEETSVPSLSKGGHKFANRLVAPMRFRLSGCLAPLWQVLVIGQNTHIGRGASLGLGRYRLDTM